MLRPRCATPSRFKLGQPICIIPHKARSGRCCNGHSRRRFPPDLNSEEGLHVLSQQTGLLWCDRRCNLVRVFCCLLSVERLLFCLRVRSCVSNVCIVILSQQTDRRCNYFVCSPVVCLFVRLCCVCLCVYLFVCLYVCLLVCLFVCLFVCCVCLFVCLFVLCVLFCVFVCSFYCFLPCRCFPPEVPTG